MCNVPDSLTRFEIAQDEESMKYEFACNELEERTADILEELRQIANDVENQHGFDMKQALKELFAEVA